MCSSAAYPSKQSENFLGEVLASFMLVSERALDRNRVLFEVFTVLVRPKKLGLYYAGTNEKLTLTKLHLHLFLSGQSYMSLVTRPLVVCHVDLKVSTCRPSVRSL